MRVGCVINRVITVIRLICRLYVDILRRVLTDYFNYDVLFVMNITDIDDKVSDNQWDRCPSSC